MHQEWGRCNYALYRREYGSLLGERPMFLAPDGSEIEIADTAAKFL